MRTGRRVHVLLETAADRYEQAPQRDVIRHARIADRTEENRVKSAKLVEPIVGHHLARLITTYVSQLQSKCVKA